MPNPLTPGIGRILSADIAVPDHARMVRFYARALTTGSTPLWRNDLMNSRGVPIIGLGERLPEYADLPLQWMPHIQVADVARSAARALERGGSELMHGRADDGTSQWAVLLDPDGAAFGLIPVPSEDQLPPGATAPPGEGAAATGRISGLELSVTDAAAARDFYRAVVGWSARDIPVTDSPELPTDYELLDESGSPVAAIRHARPGDQPLPHVWLLHLPVGDLAESLRRVRADGGEVLQEPSPTGSGCSRVVIRDPAGASLALAQG